MFFWVFQGFRALNPKTLIFRVLGNREVSRCRVGRGGGFVDADPG